MQSRTDCAGPLQLWASARFAAGLRLLEIRAERSTPRLTYVEGTLETSYTDQELRDLAVDVAERLAPAND